jgi:uncharacterized phage-associated protein
MKTTILILLSILFALTGCKKEEINTNDINENNDNDTLEMITTVGGNFESMQYFILDSIMKYEDPWSNVNNTYLDINLENEFTSDLKIRCYWYAWRWGNRLTLSIKTENSNFQVSNFVKADTLFQCGDYTNPGDSVYYYTSYNDFNCSNSTSIERIDTLNYPTFYREFETIDTLSNNWSSDNTTFIISKYKDEWMLSDKSTAEKSFYTFWIERYGAKIDNGSYYILFRNTSQRPYRYGWIKYNLFDMLKIHIEEVAYQVFEETP